MNIKSFISENKDRVSNLFGEYDPIMGVGSPLKRFEFRIYSDQETPLLIPEKMKELIVVENGLKYKSIQQYSEVAGVDFSELLNVFNNLRLKYDFEFWAFSCVEIKPKGKSEMAPFKLRSAQRKLLKELENLRVNDKPIWFILLKARQWGGSTLIQIYMAWIQLIHMKRWHSLIVGDVESQALNVRSMYTNLIEKYPDDVQELNITPFENSSKNKIIKERGCVINLGSMQQPDGIRSADINMAHLTEVGLWKKTQGKSPEDLVQSIQGTIPNIPYSLYAIESTAKGVGNFFHTSWMNANSDDKESNNQLTPVFVAWFEIEDYFTEFENENEKIEFIQSLNGYEMSLWLKGATLEGINWYRFKLASMDGNHWRMKSEFPSDPIEAFQSSGRRAFSQEYVTMLRSTVKKPEYVGDIFPDNVKGKEALTNILFEERTNGNLKIWKKPNDPPVPEGYGVRDRYAAFVDIGGKSEDSDYSVITIIDRWWMIEGDIPVAVATWRGHLDQDLFAWKAAQLCKWYNNALMAVETNSLTKDSDTEGNHFLTILDEIVEHYTNMFTRSSPEQIAQGKPTAWGFHTNKASKTMIINNYNGLLREQGYLEYDETAVNEADIYEIKENGSYGAIEGKKCHDDVLMTRMGALWLATSYMEVPTLFEIKKREVKVNRDGKKAKSLNHSKAHF